MIGDTTKPHTLVNEATSTETKLILMKEAQPKKGEIGYNRHKITITKNL